LELKHIFELEERATNEENENLRQGNQHLRNQIRALTRGTNSIVKDAKEDYEANAEEFS